ncbi:MGH1-like glycoside hydrolase domain-containing protein [Phyllobacterium zundukense]|uniref:Alpha-L-rhamnosidase six-hairpin glycosidase domain-containing protein n=1 Tax=Phyllobacterium zundukense TaxID=1867719 RepID=A0A2N9VTG5_9HYPH|nr:hypothetical protein [Phyllobacterium zundukense]ATU93265.1 hypothetical protein BLM14_17860 [Phyllobacterium zundukense]PIO42783.1 hypothetical protein B5P45_20225 [Phyllobacterium zundukense]
MALYRLHLAAALLGGLFLTGCNGSSEEAGSKGGVSPEVATECSGGTFTDGQCKPDTRVIAEPEVVCKDGTVVDGKCVPNTLVTKEPEVVCENGTVVDGQCVPNTLVTIEPEIVCEDGTVVEGQCVPDPDPEPSHGMSSINGRSFEAGVTITDAAAPFRTYQLTSSQPGRPAKNGQPAAKKTGPNGGTLTVTETAGRPVVRTSSPLFDALFALSLQEAADLTVTSISNDAYSQGNPIPCGGTVGCFKTGDLWTYVWTRDTAYAIDLGLAQINPQAARNSLLFKTSVRRDAAGTKGPETREIIQDTGSGGSWPVSTDRVVWARAAWEVLKYLDGDERTTFLNDAYTAIRNTIENDRFAVHDVRDGLYRGESSFTDWREQTYPAWVANEVVDIAMSKTLSTNVNFYKILDVASKLAKELKKDDDAKNYESWANALKTAINNELWLQDAGLYSFMKTTELDQVPVRRFELLGETLAILDGVADQDKSEKILALYPHAQAGAPVVWPQMRDISVYHNRAIWPFVSSYLIKAAAKGGNAAVVNKNFTMLMMGAALNLSNMENFDFVTLSPNDPEINSEAQLWSVGGYIGVVLDTVFGREVEMDAGIRFRPFITKQMHGDVFDGARELTLSNLDYRGRKIDVKVKLPAKAVSNVGAYQVSTASLNGATIDPYRFTPASDLKTDARNIFEIGLIDTTNVEDKITIASEANDLYGPDPVNINSFVTARGPDAQVRLNFDSVAGTAVNIYRNDKLVASNVTGNNWQDTGSRGLEQRLCYTTERYYLTGLGNVSQRTSPRCSFIAGRNPVITLQADAASNNSVSGSAAQLKTDHSRRSWSDWGVPGEELTFTVTPNKSGPHHVLVSYGNAFGRINTGITAAVKQVEISTASQPPIKGVVVMPHRSSWPDWGASSLLPVN